MGGERLIERSRNRFETARAQSETGFNETISAWRTARSALRDSLAPVLSPEAAAQFAMHSARTERALTDVRNSFDDVLRRAFNLHTPPVGAQVYLSGKTVFPDYTPGIDREQIRAAVKPFREATGPRLLVWDFDGTWSDLLPQDDATWSRPLPELHPLLAGLPELDIQGVILTARGVHEVVQVGHLIAVPELIVLGNSGLSMWHNGSSDFTVTVDHPQVTPEMCARLRGVIPHLQSLAPMGALIDDKGLSLEVKAPGDDIVMLDLLYPHVQQIAAESGLVAVHRTHYIEVGHGGFDKGQSLDALIDQLGIEAVAYFGDAANDKPAFDAIARRRAQGMAALAVLSRSRATTSDLEERTDLLVVPGPGGVAAVTEEIVRP